jgi:hypothetical protein
MTVTQLAAPFLGAIIIEVIHWYQLRAKLHLAQYRRALRSRAWWAWTAAMVVFGGMGTLVLFGNTFNQGQLLLAGAAFPAIFTKLVAAFTKQHVTYGDDAPRADEAAEPLSVGDFFLVS